MITRHYQRGGVRSASQFLMKKYKNDFGCNFQKGVYLDNGAYLQNNVYVQGTKKTTVGCIEYSCQCTGPTVEEAVLESVEKFSNLRKGMRGRHIAPTQLGSCSSSARN